MNKQFNNLLVLILLSGMALPASAALTIEDITWAVKGLDSNDVSTGPNQFPSGARVCSDIDALDTTVTFTWPNGGGVFTSSTSADTYINLRDGTLSVISLSIPAGECKDAYFEVEINRNSGAYDQTRDFVITADDGVTTAVSTPSNREVYVEYLISQNRNGVDGVAVSSDGITFDDIAPGGTMTLSVGEIYYIKLEAFTATQGYEQLESFISLPNVTFQLLSVYTTYSAASGLGSTASDRLYSDACVWDADTSSDNYRSCLLTGKAGGTITTLYQVKILQMPGALLANPTAFNALAHDFSGSSYHYNADFDSSARFAKIISATVAKAFSPRTILPGENSTLTFTIQNPGASTLTNVNFTDDLPANMSLANTTVAYTGCGTAPLPATGNLADPLTFTDITVAAYGSCEIAVTVTSSNTASSPYTNTTGNLFFNGQAGVSGSGTDTGSTGTDTLVVSSLPPGPSTCASPVTLATWAMAPAAGTTPPPLFTTKAADVSTAVASYTTVSGAQSIVTGDGQPANSWSGTAPTGGNGWSETATSSANYFQLQLDTSNYGGVRISFAVKPASPGDWANPNSNAFIKSSTDGTNFTIYEVTPGVYPQIAKSAWNTTPVSNIPAAATGSANTWFRLSFDGSGAGKVGATILLDNITIQGCPRPAFVPQLSKAFTATSIVQGNSTDLTFTLTNPNTSALTGVEFSDILPAGLLIDNPSGTPTLSETCSFATGSVTAVDDTSTITLAPVTMTASETCTIKVKVSGELAGTFNNITDNISSEFTGPNTTSTGFGTDTIDVIATPVINKTFEKSPIFTNNDTTLTFTITNPNPPSMTLSGIAFTDTLPGGVVVATPLVTTNSCGGTLTATAGAGSISLSGSSLAAGASCTLSVDVTGTTTGLKTNSVTVTFDNGGGVSGTGNTSTANVLVKVASPALGLLKQVGSTANGPWANSLSVAPAGNVYYKFSVENTGDIALTSVNISDPTLDVLTLKTSDCVWQDGDATTLTAAFALPVADADEGHIAYCVLGAYVAVASGQVTNTATTSNGSGATNVSDSADYEITNLSLVKSVASGDPFAGEGDSIVYNYLVTNNGAILAGPVTVSDNKVAVTCPALTTVGNNDSNFDNSEAITCTATYTVTISDAINGAVTNIATATVATIESNSDTVTVQRSPPTVATIGKVELSAIGVADYFAGLDVEQMDTASLLDMLAAWNPELARILASADRAAILNKVANYLDPDADGFVAALIWDTLEERGTIGFYVERLENGGVWQRINQRILPGLITAPMGGEYLLVDPGVQSGHRYQYRLIEQEATGATRAYGPYNLVMPR